MEAVVKDLSLLLAFSPVVLLLLTKLLYLMRQKLHPVVYRRCHRQLLKVGPSFLVLADQQSTQAFDYQYLEKSTIPTLKFQKSLLRLPVPKLEDTVSRYLTALKPIIPDESQYEATVQVANEFRQKDGPELHATLVRENTANSGTSYISKPWFDMYLSSRSPLLLNYAPFMAWKDDPDPRFMHLPIRVTNMLISALRFKRSLKEQLLSPEVYHLNPKKSDTDWYRTVIRLTPEPLASYVSMAMKAFPLDMSQFGSLFNGTRIPRKQKDELRSFPDSRHIVFIKAGQFYSFDVLDDAGDIKSPEEIYACVQYLTDLSVEPKLDHITPLSAQNRDTWAQARQRLVSSSSLNAESLHKVDSAIFSISLDELSFDPEAERLDAAHNFLHGNSVKQGTRRLNRWFDKSFGMMFDEKGHASITFEHSWGDGVAVLRVFNDIFKDSTKNHFVTPDTKPSAAVDPSTQVKHLRFQLSSESREDVSVAEKHWRDLSQSLEMDYALYDRMSRDYFKEKKVSPDSMFQLAFQMAYYQIYQSFAPTYESCSTAAFKHGRTEVVRSATNETKAACFAFNDSSKSADELRKCLDECSRKHFSLTKEAAMGQGFDRHLFALRLIAERQGKTVPLFADKSYSDASHFVLSTSSLFGEFFSGGGFGPVVEDGFGLGYGYVDEKLGVLCTSYKGQRDGRKMVQAFVASLDKIRHVLQST